MSSYSSPYRKFLYLIAVSVLLALLTVLPTLAQETTPEPVEVTEVPIVVPATPLPTETPTELPSATPLPTEATPESTATLVPTATPPVEMTAEVTPEATAAITVTPAVAPEITPDPAVPTSPTEPETGEGLVPQLPAGEFRVIVQLSGVTSGAALANGAMDQAAASSYSSIISTAQSSLMSAMSGLNLGFALNEAYDYIPFMALTVDSAALNYLKSSPLVAGVTTDSLNFPTLTTSTQQIGAQSSPGRTGTWDQGYDGTGWIVAVLDDGIDSDHPFFSGKIETELEACFSGSAATGDTSNCNGGVNTAYGPGAASNATCVSNAVGTSITCDHGTHVAGISAGYQSATFAGVARGAHIMPINVFTKVACTGGFCKGAWDADILGGLNWVYTMALAGHPIAAANLSLGGGRYTATCDADKPAYYSAFALLRSVNVAPIVSSGNSGYADSMSAPACVSNAISVGSVNNLTSSNPDQISSFSNTVAWLSLLAPGGSINSSIYSTNPANHHTFGLKSGTSMASPHVAGAWAVLRQRAPEASVDALLSILRATGTGRIRTGGTQSFPRINLDTALNWGLIDLITPSTSVYSMMPQLTFSTAQGGATAYEVVAKPAGAAAYSYTQWFNASICVSNPCTVSPDRPITNGLGTHDVQWYVRAYNAATYGYTPYFGPLEFSLVAITQQNPANGSTYTEVSGKPTYSWDSYPNTEYYQIYVWNTPEYTTAVDLWVSAATAGCDGDSTCSYQPNIPLYDDTYSWYVRSWSQSNGYSPWSIGRNFTVNAPPATAPTGGVAAVGGPNLSTNLIQIEFPPFAGAVYYEVFIATPGFTQTLHQQTYAAGGLTNVGGKLRTPQITINGNGSYLAYVRAYSPGGYSVGGQYGNGWTGWDGWTANNTAFTISSVPAPTSFDSNENIDPTTRGDLTFTWNHNPRNTAYEVWIGTPAYAQVYDETVQLSDPRIACVGGTCTFRPRYTLANGTYIAHVRGTGLAGFTTGGYSNSGWSDPENIGINLTAPNANNFTLSLLVALDSNPETLNRFDNPRFQFNDIAGASWYRVVLYNASWAIVHDRWYKRSDLTCGGGNCLAIPPDGSFYLTNGAYNWYLGAWGPGGYSTGGLQNGGIGWAGPAILNMAGALLTGTNGTVLTSTMVMLNANSSRPTFQWDGLNDATSYRLYVNRINADSSVTPVIDVTQRFDDGCYMGDSGELPCQYQATFDLADGNYRWWVMGFGGAGASGWSGNSSGLVNPKNSTIDVPNPGVPTLATPGENETFITNYVDFIWTAGANSNYHYLEVKKNGVVIYGTWLSRAQTACDGDTSCTLLGLNLVGGNYTYRVYSSGLGNGYASYPASLTRTFRVLD